MTDTLVVGVAEAHNRLSELIEKVQDGASVTIAKRGAPVARLVPAENAVPRLGHGPTLARIAREGLARRGGATDEELEETLRELHASRDSWERDWYR